MKKLTILLICFFQLALSQKAVKHEVYFQTDKYDILETEYNRLLLFLSDIDTLDIERIEIYGFTDDRGSDGYNLTLSNQRANAIKQVFSENEIDEKLISNVDGKGKILIKVIKETDLQKIRGLNRKAEVIVYPYDPPRELPKKEPENAAKRLAGELEVGDKILLDGLLFKQGYTRLVPSSKVVLEEIAEVLKSRPEIYFSVEGHVCCTQGTQDAKDKRTNIRNLSIARARFIYDEFLKRGIKRHRMGYTGHGHKYPLGGEPEYDRRVEIVITKIITDE